VQRELDQRESRNMVTFAGPRMELGYDALAGSSGIDRFLRVCDRGLFSLLGHQRMSLAFYIESLFWILYTIQAT
jgi:hypothetical protein